jgi:hypothetical protein
MSTILKKKERENINCKRSLHKNAITLSIIFSFNFFGPDNNQKYCICRYSFYNFHEFCPAHHFTGDCTQVTLTSATIAATLSGTTQTSSSAQAFLSNSLTRTSSVADWVIAIIFTWSGSNYIDRVYVSLTCDGSHRQSMWGGFQGIRPI